jgi:hypothetical protein
MTVKSTMAVALIATLIFLTTNAICQPLPDGQYPPYPGSAFPPGSGYPVPPGEPPQYPGPQAGPGPSAGQGPGGAAGGHPTSGPQSSEPISAPTASSTKALNFGQGETLTQQEVLASGNMEAKGGGQIKAYALISGLQQWVYYNGVWTTDPAAVYYYGSTSMLTYNDQAQNIWSWEKYPNGAQYWQNWGYRMPGYIHSRFLGDAHGWHQLAMWGSQSGWSNVIWIYVW